MPEMIKVRNKETGVSEWYSPLNARDLTTHNPEVFELDGSTGSSPQTLREGESTLTERITSDRDTRVKDNNRVVEETGVSNTEHLNATGALATGGDPDAIVKDEGEGDTEDDEDETDDDGDDNNGGTSEGAPNGIVRSTSGELVDDALVNELKGKSKPQLVAFADKEYGLALDGRKSEDTLRLAIYDAAEKADKA